MPLDTSLKTVLIIGSGPIIIGQACEFDYSGSQACQSLREEGIKVVLINSNPATVMTDKLVADKIYLLPLTPASIEKILDETPEIDTVLPTMGGQTALNLAKECGELGLWDKHNVRLIGVDLAAIDKAEDREEFRQWMIRLGVPIAPARAANSLLEGKEIAQELGIPVVIRPSYTLGGTGGGFVMKQEELDEALQNGLSASPIHEILVEKALFGWKEFEVELIRDNKDNVMVVDFVENFDPMGVHTGDSITISPTITLSNSGYQQMREAGVKMMRDLGEFAGGCNIQFAINPETEEIITIEINPRVSRSSALASKATGYPIAKIATKLAIGYSLDELKNQITHTTSAFFEPAQDYVMLKIPRWNFDKFKGADDTLGLQMKAVGEVMAIGRNFLEALQKGCQSLENNAIGLTSISRNQMRPGELLEYLKRPTWDRIFRIKEALSVGISIKTIHELTFIDPWFLYQIRDLVDMEREITSFEHLNKLPNDLLLRAKQVGFSDDQIALLLSDCTSDEVYEHRKKMGIMRVYKMVDSCSGEFEAKTPYFYSTFERKAELAEA